LQVENQIESLLTRQQLLQARREKLLRIAEGRRAPKADWIGHFSWDDQVLKLLSETFSLEHFRFLSNAA
jgi:hypothetical protein